MTGIARSGGRVSCEQPRDRGRHPYPSAFASLQWLSFLSRFSGSECHLDQCMFGLGYLKPTTFGGVLEGLEGTIRCNHLEGHPSLLGKTDKGVFLTLAAQEYPSALCRWLAVLFIDAHLAAPSAPAGGRPPAGWRGIRGLLPSGARAQPLPAADPDVWPRGEGLPVPALEAPAADAGALRAGDR